jgi:hypothetical protein
VSVFINLCIQQIFCSAIQEPILSARNTSLNETKFLPNETVGKSIITSTNAYNMNEDKE